MAMTCHMHCWNKSHCEFRQWHQRQPGRIGYTIISALSGRFGNSAVSGEEAWLPERLINKNSLFSSSQKIVAFYVINLAFEGDIFNSLSDIDKQKIMTAVYIRDRLCVRRGLPLVDIYSWYCSTFPKTYLVSEGAETIDRQCYEVYIRINVRNMTACATFMAKSKNTRG